jgi:outer membrane protein assembly factor BamB
MIFCRKVMLLLISLATVGCSSDYVPEPPAELVSFEASVDTEIDWNEQVGSGVRHYYSKLTPAVAYDRYYAADRESVVTAFDAKTGDEVWQTDILEVVKVKAFKNTETAKIASGITVARKKVFVGSESGLLTALDADLGKVLWFTELEGELLSPPTVIQNAVVVHSSNGSIFAFNVDDGKPLWRYESSLPPLTLRGTSAPSSEFGGVFVGTADGKIVVLGLDSGQPAWQKNLIKVYHGNELDRMTDIDAKPLVVGTKLYSLGFHGYLAALDVRNSNILWKREYSGFNDLVHDGFYLYFSDDHDNIIAVDSRNGQEIWRNSQLRLRKVTAPAVANGMVVVGDFEGYVHILDQNTGQFLGRIRVDNSSVLSQPVVTDGKFLVQTQDGEVARIVVK